MSQISRIREQLTQYDVDGILITSPVNRRYATGFKSSAGALLVGGAGAVFITDSRYIESARGIIRDADVQQIKGGEKYTDLIGQWLARYGVRRLGFEEEFVTQAGYAVYRERLGAELVPAGGLLSGLRVSKSGEELEKLRGAQAIADRTFADILNIISPRLTERELAAEIVYRLLKYGGENISFEPIVVSGPRSSMPHGMPGEHHLEGFVTMDFGCIWDGYCSDMTRTVALGRVTEEMETVYNTVLRAQLAGIAAARAGVLGKAVDAAARQVIADAGYGDYFGHGFGHSLGMDVHEAPSAAPSEERPLPAGTVISAEPGIYLPGKFGVRIEDVLYLTEQGSVNLTGSPKELIVLNA